MPTTHLTQAELCRRWRLSPYTLERWRSLKQGPPFLKISNRVLYRLEDIEQFEATHLRHQEPAPSNGSSSGPTISSDGAAQ